MTRFAPPVRTQQPATDPPLIIGLGEILWDMLPGGKVLGGAPANFAFHAAQLGNRGVAASRIGDDPLGREIAAVLRGLGLDSGHLQVDPAKPTGTVAVEIDAAGQPSYTITEDTAWDNMAFEGGWPDLAARAGAVCFGSLAQRARASREAIRSFLRATPDGCLRIFDINLRGAFFSREVIEEGLALARVAKLNDEELPRVAALLGLEAGADSINEEHLARALIRAGSLDLVCVTRGAKGSILVTADETNAHPGFPVTVADTIGSGDAFVAAAAHHLLRGSPLARVNEAANRLGAWVASQSGATPKISQSVLAEVI